MKDKIRTFVSKNAMLLVLALAALSIPLASYLHEFFKPKAVASSERKPWVVYDVSETLQLLEVPLVYDLNGQRVDKDKVRSEPMEVRSWVPRVYSTRFLVPGEAGLRDSKKHWESPPGWYRDENLVDVYHIEPWSKEDYEKNPPWGRDMRKSWEFSYGDRLARGDLPFDFYGMSCYRHSHGTNEGGEYSECLMEIKNGEWARAMVYNLPLQGQWVPKIRVSYFSKAYGGLTIKWEVHAKHAAKWKEIDAKFWRLLDERNLRV